MRKMTLGVIALCCAFSSSVLYAQTVEVTAEPIGVKVLGNNVLVGNEVRYYNTYKTDYWFIRDNTYGAELTPIFTKMGRTQNMAYRVKIGPAFFRTMRFNVNGNTEGNLVSPRPTEVLTSGIYNGVRSIYTVQMFGQTLYPATNDSVPSGLSNVAYDANNNLSFRLSSIGVQHNILDEAQDWKLVLDYGFTWGKINNSREEGEQSAMVIYETNYFYDEYNNNISIRSSSRSHEKLRGPIIGLTLSRNAKPMEFFAGLEVGALRGSYSESGTWVNKDRVTSVRAGGPVNSDSQSLTGTFSMKRDGQEAITLLGISSGVRFSLNKSGSFKVGLKINGQVLNNVRMAPNWEVSDNWTIFESSGWKERHSTLGIYSTAMTFTVSLF
jgi:hypothetical protein